MVDNISRKVAISNVSRNEFYVFLRFYAALNGSLLPTFRKSLSVPSSRVEQYKPLVDGTDSLPRNFGDTAILSCVNFQKSVEGAGSLK